MIIESECRAPKNTTRYLTVMISCMADRVKCMTPTLLVFCLLYTSWCIAAVAAVKRELGGMWATIMVVNQCVVAWVCALLVRLVAVMLF